MMEIPKTWAAINDRDKILFQADTRGEVLAWCHDEGIDPDVVALPKMTPNLI